MTHQEILTKAIEKAIAGGMAYKGYLTTGKFFIRDDDTVIIETTEQVESQDEYGLTTTFNNEFAFDLTRIVILQNFAKALWGAEMLKIPKYVKENNVHFFNEMLPSYLAHLQQMVIAEDPIAYLGENI